MCCEFTLLFHDSEKMGSLLGLLDLNISPFVVINALSNQTPSLALIVLYLLLGVKVQILYFAEYISRNEQKGKIKGDIALCISVWLSII